jgi:hypothetical protein
VNVEIDGKGDSASFFSPSIFTKPVTVDIVGVRCPILLDTLWLVLRAWKPKCAVGSIGGVVSSSIKIDSSLPWVEKFERGTRCIDEVHTIDPVRQEMELERKSQMKQGKVGGML